MLKKKWLSSASALAFMALPAMAMAATTAPHMASLTIAPVTTVDLSTIAKSAANARALSRPSPFSLPALRFPTADGRPRLAKPMAVLAPNTTVVPYAKSDLASTPESGFNGSYDGQLQAADGFELEPPDQGLAASNNVVYEVINNVLQIFKSDGTALTGAISTYALFGVNTSTSFLSDPHVEFDPDTGRWFVEQLVQESNGFNGFALAVSKTGDPLGAYYVYMIDDQGANISGCFGSCLPDYPQPGYDHHAFFIDADLFSNVTGGFVNAGVYALPKAALIAGQSFSYDYYVVPEFVLEPAIPAKTNDYDTKAGGTEYFETSQNAYYGNNLLAIYAMIDTAAVGTSSPPSLYSTTVMPEPYTSTNPATEPNDVGPYGQSVGATTSPQLDGGYNAVSGGVKYFDHTLFSALDTGTTDNKGLPTDEIAYFKVHVSTTASSVSATMGDQGYLVPPSGYAFLYPTVATGPHDYSYIGMTITGIDGRIAGGYPSAGVIKFRGGHPKGSQVLVTGQGAASDDGFTGYVGAGPATVGRWGDYGSSSVDPITGYVYTGNEYIPDATVYPRGTYANWGTFITELK